MKEYFYLEGKDQRGPFALEEIKAKGLTNETLVWFDGIENWTPLINIPELNIVVKKSPPPPPMDNEDIKNKLEEKTINDLKNSPNNSSSPNIFKPTKNEIMWFICWSSFHFFALILSNVKFFNFNLGLTFHETPKESFWPFVTFVQRKYDQLPGGQSWEYYEDMWAQKRFNGLFYQYDWTEFVLYIGAGIIFYLMIKVFKNM